MWHSIVFVFYAPYFLTRRLVFTRAGERTVSVGNWLWPPISESSVLSSRPSLFTSVTSTLRFVLCSFPCYVLSTCTRLYCRLSGRFVLGVCLVVSSRTYRSLDPKPKVLYSSGTFYTSPSLYPILTTKPLWQEHCTTYLPCPLCYLCSTVPDLPNFLESSRRHLLVSLNHDFIGPQI